MTPVMPLMILSIALSSPSLADGSGVVEALAGARSAPQLTAQGPAELSNPNGPSSVTAARVDAESASRQGAWVGGAAEVWAYGPDPEVSVLRVEPRAGWRPPLRSAWRAELGARYALEVFPWHGSLGSGRGELTGSVGPIVGPVRLGLEGTYVQRDFFSIKAWTFRDAEADLLVATAPSQAGMRASVRLGGQLNGGFTTDSAGVVSPASGSQLRARADLGWTARTVDINLAWHLISSYEGNVEDAARPQFTPIGQYADDADALSAGGFIQHRVDVSAAWLPGPDWVLGLDGMVRLRQSVPNQASASLATTFHMQARVDRALTDRLSVFATAGGTQLELVLGVGAVDIYGWAGLRWHSGR